MSLTERARPKTPIQDEQKLYKKRVQHETAKAAAELTTFIEEGLRNEFPGLDRGAAASNLATRMWWTPGSVLSFLDTNGNSCNLGTFVRLLYFLGLRLRVRVEPIEPKPVFGEGGADDKGK